MRDLQPWEPEGGMEISLEGDGDKSSVSSLRQHSCHHGCWYGLLPVCYLGVYEGHCTLRSSMPVFL